MTLFDNIHDQFVIKICSICCCPIYCIIVPCISTYDLSKNFACHNVLSEMIYNGYLCCYKENTTKCCFCYTISEFLSHIIICVCNALCILPISCFFCKQCTIYEKNCSIFLPRTWFYYCKRENNISSVIIQQPTDSIIIINRENINTSDV